MQFSSKNAVSEFRTLFAQVTSISLDVEAEGLQRAPRVLKEAFSFQSVDLAKHNDIRESNEFVPTPIFSEN